ncbi:hypothetical protein Tco_0940402 [Tanacetum coccineum]|uniref:No apical meristem-associated C-terminal domain-containing protein n=1 Tax=Tanacetum coccineum TaxID=301880 RepID=A0ABQ5DNM7_9ASTR
MLNVEVIKDEDGDDSLANKLDETTLAGYIVHIQCSSRLNIVNAARSKASLTEQSATHHGHSYSGCQHSRESGAGDEDYVQRAMIHHEIDTGVAFKLRHWSWGSKRHKSSGSSSFNTKSGEQSINLNTIVDDNDEDEAQDIRAEGRDKARAAARKKKGSKSRSTSNVNKDALAKLMVTEMTAQEKEECLAFLDIKRREVECREREIEQRDMRSYL